MKDIDDYLQYVFSSFGVILEKRNGWLSSAADFPRCRTQVHAPRQTKSLCLARLDVDVALDADRVVIESFGDAGKDSDHALENACRSFVGGSCPVFLSALWDRCDETQVQREHWSLDAGDWIAHIGQVLEKSSIEDPMTPQNFRAEIQNWFQSIPISYEIHWLRVYFANIGRDRQVVEVLLDNVAWEFAEDKLRNLDWPDVDYFYSSRLFLMLVPCYP